MKRHFSRLQILVPLLLLPALFSVSAFAGIFGEDDREFVTRQSPVKIQELAKSVAVQIPFGRLKNFSDLNATTYSGVSSTYQSEWNTCPGTRFNDQSSLPTCTAFLVAPDLLLTAAHCGVVNQAGCDFNAWVFDYRADESGIKTSTTSDPIFPLNLDIDASKLYRCKKIVSSKYDPSDSGMDYSLIQLNRPVLDRAPLKLKSDGHFTGKESLFSIGAMGGTFLVTTKPMPIHSLTTSRLSSPFDLIAKGSGGPVFESETGFVVGIAVASSKDFYYRDFTTRSSAGVHESCQRPFPLGEPYTDQVKLPDGSLQDYPYSQAERIDFLPEVLRILELK